jgi:hypothetical protein
MYGTGKKIYEELNNAEKAVEKAVIKGYNAIETSAGAALAASAVAAVAAVVTGDPNLALTALGLGKVAEAAHDTAAVGQAAAVPENKEGLESKLAGQ